MSKREKRRGTKAKKQEQARPVEAPKAKEGPREPPKKTRKIKDDFGNPHRYVFALLPAGEGAALGRKIFKLLGVSLSQAGAGAARGFEPASLAGGFFDFSDILEELGDAAFFKEILGCAIRDDADVLANFDEIYAGNYGEMYEAGKAALAVNFGPFFHRVAGDLMVVAQKQIQVLLERFVGSLPILSDAASDSTSSTS